MARFEIRFWRWWHICVWIIRWQIGFLIAFILYQVYELIISFSWGLFALTVFDVFIVLLTWREYQLHRFRS